MNFIKTFLAALLAFVVGNILLVILMFMLFAGIAAVVGDSVPTVKRNTVLKLDLTGGISDSPSTSAISSIGLGGISFDNSNSIYDVLLAVERATFDDNIIGIYINLDEAGRVSLSQVEELRNALKEFRESGKFIISYSDSYSQVGYYLSSVADGVYLNPQGGVDWRGLSASIMFYKGLFEKLGIQPQILRHGTFKAAVEPYMLDKMSPENRLQTSTWLNTIWGSILEEVSLSRGIDSAVLSNYATELSVRSAEDAIEYGFADGLMYADQLKYMFAKLGEGDFTVQQAAYLALTKEDHVNTQVNPEPVSDNELGADVTELEVPEENTIDAGKDKEKIKDPAFISIANYITATKAQQRKTSKNKIAVIYADGDIIDGNSTDGSVGGTTVSAKIRKAREDENVKAVVLRVNSPGGSALASEVMWREMELIRKEKPVIVSMGGMAASGGYYISCPADIILANRSTLTGSIGVFGMTFDVSPALRSKLGITVDVVRTNPSADLGSLYRGLSYNEREAYMEGIEDVYNTFVNHVADGRNMSFEAVDAIGGGRVWSGVSAEQIGLVDGFGGLFDAIKLAADRAMISDDFRVWEVVDEPDGLAAIVKQIGNIRVRSLRNDLAESFIQYNSIMNMVDGYVYQARMPYIMDIR